MVTAQFENVSTLKKIIDSIEHFLTGEITFDCSKTDLSLMAMDSSKIAFVSLKLQKKLFKAYRCEKGITFGLDLKKLIKVLQFVDDKEACEFTLMKDNVTFMFWNADDMTKSRELILQLSPEHDRILPLESTYDVVIQMSSSQFAKTCQEISEFNADVKICAMKNSTRDCITFSDKDDEYLVTYTSPQENDENKVITMKIAENIIICCSVKYLLQFAKASSFSDQVRLYFGKNMPIHIKYKINEDDGYLSYYVAPIVDDETDADMV